MDNSASAKIAILESSARLYEYRLLWPTSRVYIHFILFVQIPGWMNRDNIIILEVDP